MTGMLCGGVLCSCNWVATAMTEVLELSGKSPPLVDPHRY